MKSSNGNFGFIAWTDSANIEYNSLCLTRSGETRIGQVVCALNEAKFVILGIEESVGPKTNKGRGGAEFGFSAFCAKFLNMQYNTFLKDRKIAFLGRIYATDNTIQGSSYVDELDEFVAELLRSTISKDQVLITIGGGHNNALPLLQFYAESSGDPGQVVNLDPHADYRALEGRHSGNAFSYAYARGYLSNYTVFGMHQAYNNQWMLDALKQDGHACYWFENWIDLPNSFEVDLQQVKQQNEKHAFLGIELDMDAIERMPSSAQTPSGVSVLQARQFIRVLASIQAQGYLHLPEGAPETQDDAEYVGKALAYFVHDFISCHRND